MNAYTLMLAEFFLVLLLFFWTRTQGSRGSRVSFALTFLVFGIFAQISLVQIKLGPVSVRIYVALLLSAIVALDSAAQKNIMSILSRHRGLFVAFVLFYIWIVIADGLAGRIYDKGIQRYIRDFLSDYVAAVLFFVASLGLIRKKGDVEFVAKGIVMVAAISAFFAVGQYFNVGFATRVYEVLNPFEVDERIAAGRYGLGRDHVSGLSTYSIPFIYTLITFLPLSFSFALLGTKKSSLLTACALGIFLIGAIASVLARSRSGVLGFSLSFLMITVMAPRIFRGINTRNYFRLGMATMLLLIVAFMVRETTSNRRIETRYENFSRMGEFWDQQRVDFAYATIQESARDPILGYGAAKFTKKYKHPPHNTFLNSIIWYGLPGLAFAIYYHLYFVRIAFSDLKRLRLEDWSWVTIGTLVGLFNYLWNGMSHNESFVAGGIFGFIVLGLFLTARELSLRSATAEPDRVFYGQMPAPIHSRYQQ